MGALFGAAYFFFLPWVLSGILVSWLFAGPGRGHVRLVVVVGRSWPLPSGLGRPRDGPDLPHSLGGRHPRCAPSEPQATTASNDGGCADRLRTRVPRCTPTGLSRPFRVSIRANPLRPASDDDAGTLISFTGLPSNDPFTTPNGDRKHQNVDHDCQSLHLY